MSNSDNWNSEEYAVSREWLGAGNRMGDFRWGSLCEWLGTRNGVGGDYYYAAFAYWDYYAVGHGSESYGFRQLGGQDQVEEDLCYEDV